MHVCDIYVYHTHTYIHTYNLQLHIGMVSSLNWSLYDPFVIRKQLRSKIHGRLRFRGGGLS